MEIVVIFENGLPCDIIWQEYNESRCNDSFLTCAYSVTHQLVCIRMYHTLTQYIQYNAIYSYFEGCYVKYTGIYAVPFTRANYSSKNALN